MSTFDTLHIVKGKFDYQIPVDGGPYTYVILYPNYSTLGFQAHSGSDIRIRGDALSLNQVRVEGADSILPQQQKMGKKLLSIGGRLPKSDIVEHKPGTYLLIVFWADWRHGSSSLNYHVRQALRDHPDSLYAISYSLDVDPEFGRVRETIEDTTHWHTYCDYRGWSSPLLARYGIRNIPWIILVGPKGKIQAMGGDYNRDIKPYLTQIQ